MPGHCPDPLTSNSSNVNWLMVAFVEAFVVAFAMRECRLCCAPHGEKLPWRAWMLTVEYMEGVDEPSSCTGSCSSSCSSSLWSPRGPRDPRRDPWISGDSRGPELDGFGTSTMDGLDAVIVLALRRTELRVTRAIRPAIVRGVAGESTFLSPRCSTLPSTLPFRSLVSIPSTSDLVASSKDGPPTDGVGPPTLLGPRHPRTYQVASTMHSRSAKPPRTTPTVRPARLPSSSPPREIRVVPPPHRQQSSCGAAKAQRKPAQVALILVVEPLKKEQFWVLVLPFERLVDVSMRGARQLFGPSKLVEPTAGASSMHPIGQSITSTSKKPEWRTLEASASRGTVQS